MCGISAPYSDIPLWSKPPDTGHFGEAYDASVRLRLANRPDARMATAAALQAAHSGFDLRSLHRKGAVEALVAQGRSLEDYHAPTRAFYLDQARLHVVGHGIASLASDATAEGPGRERASMACRMLRRLGFVSCASGFACGAILES